MDLNDEMIDASMEEDIHNNRFNKFERRVSELKGKMSESQKIVLKKDKSKQD